MYKTNLVKRTCLLASTILLSVPQAAMSADEATVSISGWINEGLLYYDDGEGTGVAQISDNGTTLGSRITFSGDYKPENSSLEAGFEVIIEPLSGNPNFAGGGSVTPLLFADQDNLETVRHCNGPQASHNGQGNNHPHGQQRMIGTKVQGI